MKLPRTSLPQPIKTRLIAHFTEQAVLQGITPERALYNSARITGISADDVDALYAMSPGSAAAWVTANKLPPLDGVPVALTAAQILADQ